MEVTKVFGKAGYGLDDYILPMHVQESVTLMKL